MRLTLVTVMLTELSAELENYFAYTENLLIITSFLDILKSSIFFSKIRNIKKKFKNCHECKIINVKFNFAPSIDDVINKLLRFLGSESNLMTYINAVNDEKILFFLNLSRATLYFLETVDGYESVTNLPKHRLKSTLNRCKITNLLLEIISRFQELAGPELSKSFKIYNTFKNSSKSHNLIGGIIYFLFIICFETFTPGLYEFVRLSLKDLDKIVELDPSLVYFNPEMNLIRTVLTLSNRSDQLAIDCALHFFIFDLQNLSADFLIILNSFINISSSSEVEIAVKLIEKFGNQNLVHLFVTSYGKFQFKGSILSTNDSEPDFNDVNLAQSWIADFNNHMKLEI